MDSLREDLERIAELTREQVGRSEENVKQKIVVPLLECFGHHRNQLDFEYTTGRKRVDIFIKDLPKDCKVIIDTKNYDEDLSDHLEQIGSYAHQEGAILALIINGEEIRIYDPFFSGGRSFCDRLLYSLKRTELTNDLTIKILYDLLSRENLKNRRIKDFIDKRKQEILEADAKKEEIEGKFEKQEKELLDKKETFNKKLGDIQETIRSISEEITKIDSEIAKIDSEKHNEISEVLESIGLPYIRTTISSEIAPPDIRKPRTRNKVSKHANRIEIILNNLHTPRSYGLIPLPREYRSFFPGFKVPFILETDIGEITTKVTSGRKGTKFGDPEAGNYIQGGLNTWYDKHKELKEGNKLIIEVIESKKRYSLSISR